ncbi:PREDICTED: PLASMODESMATA CALLOSE-BINDING PROTEIN 3 isoform X2 [Tarenaya hassleriana]|uniref:PLASMODESMATA CALLOSE-BINDING PROTEIN 3 isoform X2 n=1 Tax=Tarenaya hassleriana TaxID=28532 RepID=UPI00053C5DD4|nr:PREDICTED: PLASMODESMATA CALLOSE-BINDING PROTEIN 3 isoform X2 [Tarenaya hassleriana]
MAIAVAVLLLAMAGYSSGTWCVCREGLSDGMLQKTLDYACGAGADCGPIHQNGPCFNPNTVKAHCSYAVNSYFQKKSQSPGSCDFAGTATFSASDPSYSGCPFPASASDNDANNGSADDHEHRAILGNAIDGGRDGDVGTRRDKPGLHLSFSRV